MGRSMFTCWPVLHVPCYVACRRLTGQARCSKKKFVEQLQNIGPHLKERVIKVGPTHS